jgi:hypothetical protein
MEARRLRPGGAGGKSRVHQAAHPVGKLDHFSILLAFAPRVGTVPGGGDVSCDHMGR